MQLEAYSELAGFPMAEYSLATSLPTYFKAVSRLAVSAGATCSAGAASLTGSLSTGLLSSTLEEATVSFFAGLDSAFVSAFDSALDSADASDAA